MVGSPEPSPGLGNAPQISTGQRAQAVSLRRCHCSLAARAPTSRGPLPRPPVRVARSPPRLSVRLAADGGGRP